LSKNNQTLEKKKRFMSHLTRARKFASNDSYSSVSISQKYKNPVNSYSPFPVCKKFPKGLRS
jgi:hypothetical protein